MASLTEAVASIVPIDEAAAANAEDLQASFSSPSGSLGLVDDIGAQLAGIARRCPPPIPNRPVVAVFAADHGVLVEGVSPWPVETTAEKVAGLLAGRTAVSVIAADVGASVLAVNVGVAGDVPTAPPHPGDSSSGVPGRLVGAKVRRGTDNMLIAPAMSRAEAVQSIQAGLTLGDKLVEVGADLLVAGDVGAGSTTAAAALVSALTGWPPRAVTGRGSGVSDEMFEVKVGVVERAMERVAEAHGVARTALQGLPADVLLAELGGLEIGAVAGLAIAGAYRRVPVLVDGVVSLAGVLVAAAIVPDVVGYLIAGHRSLEPGATAAMEHLGLDPLLDMRLRIGEGTGACLAVPLVRAAARLLREMASPAGATIGASAARESAEPPASPGAPGDPLGPPRAEEEDSPRAADR